MKIIKITFYPEKSKPITLTCENAISIRDKIKGLMGREKLDNDKGMIFSFIIPWYRFFWMKNVKIPLDIIFINRKNKVIKIHEAKVESGILYKNYWSNGFCKYVVEINIGFCKKNNIIKGTKIGIIKKKKFEQE